MAALTLGIGYGVGVDGLGGGGPTVVEPAAVTHTLGLSWMVWTEETNDPPVGVPIPTDAIMQAVNDSVTLITRRIEVLNSDESAYCFAAPFLSGSVTISLTSTERRTFEAVIHADDDELLEIGPGAFWYDKVIRMYRGARTDAVTYEGLLGTFLIDKISRPHSDGTVSISGRDYTKKLSGTGSKLAFATYFPANEPIENIISVLATNGGITKQSLPLTGDNTSDEITFSAGTDRWAAMVEIANAYDWELYFDVDGTLVLEEYPDLDNDALAYVFQTGAAGNLESYNKSASDARIRNHVVVIGQNSEQVPVVAEVRNTNPSSPTNIDAIGERTETIESAFISDYDQALALANRYLSIAGLDSYEVPFGAIVMPWIDVGTVAEFVDPDPTGVDPTRFLLTDVTVPLQLEPMTGTMRRIVNVS